MKYQMDDGTVVDLQKASHTWAEKRDFDGSNNVGRSSGSQFHWQMLCRSRKGRYYVHYSSNWQGSRDHVEWISPEAAARWLLVNERELPEDLKKYEEEVVE